MEEGLEGRAGDVDGAVQEVVPGDAFLSLDDVVDAIDEVLFGLLLGTEHFGR